MEIRSATKNDIESFKAVVKLSIMESCKEYYSHAEIKALLKQYPERSLYEKWLYERVLIVAVDDGDVVGFAQYNPNMSYIEAVHVLPKYFGEGVGRELVGAIERIASEMGAKVITLESSLNAVCFYDKCGYIKKGNSKFKCNSGIELKVVEYEKQIYSE